jgi:SAM-dependent methyltransferase
MEPHQAPPQAAIMHIIADYWRSRAVYLAARLKLADAVGNSRRVLTDIAATTGTRPEALRRLLRALTAHGIFREEEDGTFAQTPLSEVLRSGIPGSMRAFAEVELGHDHYDSWRDAESCLTHPGTVFDRIFKMPIWRYYAEHPELEALFGEAMTNLTAIANAGVLGSYQFGAFSSAVDVGGGHGSFLAAILDGNPAAKGILFDLPSVLEDAARGEFVARLGDRVRLIGGDFFEEVPSGGDLYLLKFVLHDWDDADSVRILANVRRAVAPSGRLAVVEMVLPGRNEPHIGPLMDLNMMVMTGGIERTSAEFGSLLAKAGFRLERVTGTKSPFSVVEAVPI